jgi:hypothetical protein
MTMRDGEQQLSTSVLVVGTGGSGLTVGYDENARGGECHG